MGEGGLRFHIAGFPVSVPLGGILGVLLIAYLWTPNFSEPGRSGITLAVVFAVLLYAGVLVHELAHAWAARAFGYPVHGITLWLLGGYTVYERRSSRPWPELVIAVIGPVSTLLLASRLLGAGGEHRQEVSRCCSVRSRGPTGCSACSTFCPARHWMAGVLSSRWCGLSPARRAPGQRPPDTPD